MPSRHLKKLEARMHLHEEKIKLFLGKITVLLIFIIGSYFMFEAINLGDALALLAATLVWGIGSFAAFLFNKKKIVRIPFILGVVLLVILVPFVFSLIGGGIILFFLPSVSFAFAISSLSYLFLGREKTINPS